MVSIWNEPRPLDDDPDVVAGSNPKWVNAWKFSADGQPRGLERVHVFAGSYSHWLNAWKFNAGEQADRLQRNRVAEVASDQMALQVLDLLDQNTSMRWEDLAEQTKMSWADVCRSVAFLTRAGICEPGPVRVRLSRKGALLLAESPPSE